MIRLTIGTRTFPIVALLAAAAFAALPAHALAAPGAALERVDLQFDPGVGGNAPVLIITGTLPATTPLPATIRLSIPQRMTVLWAGEVLGGALEDDPTLQPAIEHGENGYDIASLTLSEGWRGQIELEAPGLLVQDGSSRHIRLAWMPSDAVGVLGLATAIPAGATIETVTAGVVTGPGPSNGTLLTLEATAAPGVETVLEARYAAPSESAGGASAPAGSSTPLLVIFGGLAVLFTAAGIAISKRSRTRVCQDVSAIDDTSGEPDRPRIASEQVVADDDLEPDSDSPPPDPVTTSRRGPRPRTLILILVALVLGGAVFALARGEAPGTTQTTNEYVYKVLTNAKADATASFPLTLSEGDPAHESVHVFEALAAVPAVRSGRLIIATGVIEVAYDSSRTDAEGIAAALAAAGYGR